MLGVALATTAGFSWLFVLPTAGQSQNAYIGLLTAVVIPAILILGLMMIPVGVWLSRRRIRTGLAQVREGGGRAAWRRMGLFLGLMTFVNLVIGSQATYRAVQHMESRQFCGQTCHVMTPEFTASRYFNHARLDCVECHVEPGAAGFISAKIAGTRQLMDVTFDRYPRPIKSAIEDHRLVPASDTCERCHNRARELGPRIKVLPHFKDDEANTRTDTVLTMRVGGPTSGIHGAHIGTGVKIRFAPSDDRRQTIPWIERTKADGKVDVFLAADAKPGSTDSLTRYELQCTDCHNRAAHSMETAEKALDRALAGGEIPLSLPFVRKNAMPLLTAAYSSNTEATSKIAAGLQQIYGGKSAPPDIAKAVTTITGLYNRNVFPDLKVTWGTYSNNLGHMESPGCFRCHDDGHANAAKKTITNDCAACHEAVAMEETAPAILKTLGIEK
jgi:nitrate/TMAO reductase-like tetraheme cytochrome c subunit